ncbi:MAG: hypothetical protein KAT43_03410 [Nanoarchaeota archaeon]|nr:hypothetical protein [Nanoarchaeota archaeon]
MVTLNDLLLDASVCLYEVREQWHTTDHDYPCLGAIREHKYFDERREVYSSKEKADQVAEAFSAEVRKKMLRMDEFDQLREAAKHGIPRNADDFSYRFAVKEHVVLVKDLEEKDSKVFWKISKGSIEVL